VLVVAAPSPLYVFVMIEALTRDNELQLQAGTSAMLAWAVLGVALLRAASRRCAAITGRHAAMLAEGDRVLAAEDAAAAEAASAAVSADAAGLVDGGDGAEADAPAPSTP
jgi:hypothetical protein